MEKTEIKRKENLILITAFIYSLIVLLVAFIQVFIGYTLISILQIGVCLAFIAIYFLGYLLNKKGKVKAHFANSWVIGMQLAFTVFIQQALLDFEGFNGEKSYLIFFCICRHIIYSVTIVYWIYVLILERKINKEKVDN